MMLRALVRGVYEVAGLLRDKAVDALAAPARAHEARKQEQVIEFLRALKLVVDARLAVFMTNMTDADWQKAYAEAQVEWDALDPEDRPLLWTDLPRMQAEIHRRHQMLDEQHRRLINAAHRVFSEVP